MRKTATAFVVLIGVVSLFADMTYEGARGVTGPFLAVLGAGASVVGIVLIVVPPRSCPFAPLAFSTSFGLAVAGAVFSGIGMGARESIVRRPSPA